MDTIIYTASPLKAFSGSLFMIAFFFILGGSGVITSLFNRRERALVRIGIGFASVILLLAGGVAAIVTIRSYQNGDKTVSVHVDKKRETKRNCDGKTCIDYVAETSAGQKYYVFNLSQDVWEKIEVNSCYQFTYYPAESLLGEYLQDDTYPDLYETTGDITRIERANCP